MIARILFVGGKGQLKVINDGRNRVLVKSSNFLLPLFHLFISFFHPPQRDFPFQCRCPIRVRCFTDVQQMLAERFHWLLRD